MKQYIRNVQRLLVVALLGIPTPVRAQVALHPTTIQPAAWERVSLRVVNQQEDPIVSISLTIPEVIDVLGVDTFDDWSFRLERAGDSTPQRVEWTGGSIDQWEFDEFAFYGRVGPDVRRKELIFLVDVTRSSGETVSWSPRNGADALPPTIAIVGTTEVSRWGVFALASAAIGIAALALAFSVARRG